MQGKFAVAHALAVSVLGAPLMASADCKLMQVAEFHTDPDFPLPMVDGAVNGKPVKVLVDTGMIHSLIPLHEARRLGLLITERPGERMYDAVAGDTQVYGTKVRLKVGNSEKADLAITVAGDAYTPSRYSVVLGDDFFSQVDTEFDLPHHAIRLFKPQDCAPAQLVYWGTPYSQTALAVWERDEPELAAEAVLNGRKLAARFDSGTPASVVDAGTAQEDGVRWSSDAKGPTFYGFGPSFQDSRIGLFDSFALGDERVTNIHLPVAHIQRDEWYAPRMWLGADFFRAHRIFVDVQDHLLLFSYAGGPIFDQDVSKSK